MVRLFLFAIMLTAMPIPTSAQQKWMGDLRPKTALPIASISNPADGIATANHGLNAVSLEQQDVIPRCVADGVTDCLPAFKAAIAKFSYAPFVRSGGQIVLSAGSYFVSSPIDMSGKYGLSIIGSGGISTQVVSKGNYPVFTASGTYKASLYGIAIRNLNVVCGGKMNVNANGIVWNYVNHGVIDGNLFFSCNKAISVTGQFLSYITNNNISGKDSQQNNVCLQGEFPTDTNDTYGNNALVVSRNLCQFAAQAGFRLIDANGSLFDHNQIMAPNIGVYACDQPATTYPSGLAASCQFMFFDQDQVDSSTSEGWLFKRGKGAVPGPSIILNQPWAGSTRGAAFSFDGGLKNSIIEAEIQTADIGIVLNDVSDMRVTGRISGYNGHNRSSPAVLLSGTTRNNYLNITSDTKFPVTGTYNGISEIDRHDNNRFYAGSDTCRIEISFGGNSVGTAYAADPGAGNPCQYEINGRSIRLQYQIKLVSKGSSKGDAMLSGLPVQSAPSAGWSIGSINTGLAVTDMAGLNGNITTIVVPNSTTANLYSQNPAGLSRLTDANFTNSTTISGSVEYFKR